MSEVIASGASVCSPSEIASGASATEVSSLYSTPLLEGLTLNKHDVPLPEGAVYSRNTEKFITDKSIEEITREIDNTPLVIAKRTNRIRSSSVNDMATSKDPADIMKKYRAHRIMRREYKDCYSINHLVEDIAELFPDIHYVEVRRLIGSFFWLIMEAFRRGLQVVVPGFCRMTPTDHRRCYSRHGNKRLKKRHIAFELTPIGSFIVNPIHPEYWGGHIAEHTRQKMQMFKARHAATGKLLRQRAFDKYGNLEGYTDAYVKGLEAKMIP